MCVRAHLSVDMHLCVRQARRQCQIPWSWGYRQLWVLGTKVWSSKSSMLRRPSSSRGCLLHL